MRVTGLDPNLDLSSPAAQQPQNRRRAKALNLPCLSSTATQSCRAMTPKYSRCIMSAPDIKLHAAMAPWLN